MKQKIILLLTLLLATGNLLAADNPFAIKLEEQIKQNVEQAHNRYVALVNEKPPSLSIQVRTEQQRQLLQNLADWLEPISLIKIEPIQLVKDGPKKSQLRFFSRQDKREADDLLKNLKKIFPQLELQDFSEQYGSMSWMETGHFELWLAPDLKRIELPPTPPKASVPPAPARIPVAPPKIRSR